MADFNQQTFSADQQFQPTHRPFPGGFADSYTLLLFTGLIVLLVSLGCLALIQFRYYGLLIGPRPVFGEVTTVSDAGIGIDIGSDDGLAVGQQLLLLRKGVFLSDVSVRTVEPDSATVSPEDQAARVTRGDTVAFSPLVSKP